MSELMAKISYRIPLERVHKELSDIISKHDINETLALFHQAKQQLNNEDLISALENIGSLRRNISNLEDLCSDISDILQSILSFSGENSESESTE